MEEIIYIHVINHQNPFVVPIGSIAVMNQIKYRKKGYYSNEITKEIIKKAKVIIMDLHWYHSLWSITQIAKDLKRVNHNIKIILGGYTATLYAERLLAKYQIDFVVIGDGEVGTSQLVHALIEGKDLNNIPNVLTSNTLNYNKRPKPALESNFNELDYYTIDWFPSFIEKVKENCQKDIYGGSDDSYWPIIPVNRGCPYSCSLCYGSKDNTEIFFGRKPIFRSYKKIKQDLCRLEKDDLINNVYFIGDFLSFYDEEKCKSILDKKYNLNLYYEFFNLPDLQLLKLLISRFNWVYLTFPLYKDHGESSEVVKFEDLYEIIDVIEGRAKFLIFAHKDQQSKIPKSLQKYIAYNDGWHVPQPDPMLINRSNQEEEFNHFMEISEKTYGNSWFTIHSVLTNIDKTHNYSTIERLNNESYNKYNLSEFNKIVMIKSENPEIVYYEIINEKYAWDSLKFGVKYNIVSVKDFFLNYFNQSLHKEKYYLIEITSPSDLEFLNNLVERKINGDYLNFMPENLDLLKCVTFKDLCRFSSTPCSDEDKDRCALSYGWKESICSNSKRHCVRYGNKEGYNKKIGIYFKIIIVLQRLIHDNYISLKHTITVIYDEYEKNIFGLNNENQQLQPYNDIIIFIQKEYAYLYDNEKDSIYKVNKYVLSQAFAVITNRSTITEISKDKNRLIKIIRVINLLI